MKKPLSSSVTQLLDEHRSIKIWITIKVEYERVVPRKDNNDIIGYLRCKFHALAHGSDYDEFYDHVAIEITEKNINFMREASGLRIKQVTIATLDVARYNPMIGSSYKELPKFLKFKKAIVNVMNNDNRCFGYAIFSAIHAADVNEHNRSKQYTYNKYFNGHALNTLRYPVAVEDLTSVEAAIGIRINVFGFHDDEGKARYPIYYSTRNIGCPAVSEATQRIRSQPI